MSQRTRVSGHEKEKRRATFNKKLHAVLSTESRAYLKRYVYKITHSFIIYVCLFFFHFFTLSLSPLFPTSNLLRCPLYVHRSLYPTNQMRWSSYLPRSSRILATA